MNFFRKGLKSLEAVEPQIRVVAEKQHIDYQLVELDDSEDGGKSYEANDGGELSFDYRQNKQELNDPFPLRDSMEVNYHIVVMPLFSFVEDYELPSFGFILEILTVAAFCGVSILKSCCLPFACN